MTKKKTLDEAPKDEFVYVRDSAKSMDTIKKELIDEATKEDEVEKKEEETPTPPEEPKTPEPEVKPEEKEEPKEDVSKIAREAAEKATEDLKREIDEIKGQNLTKKQEEEAIEEAKTRWTKEGRNPKDYDEIVVEAEERAFNRMQKFIEERERKKEEELANKTKQEQEAQQQAEEQHKTVLEQTQASLARELQELEEGGYIPKVSDPNDENDEGNRVRKALFIKGVEVNNERIKKGLPPENSIAKVFFMHFKGVSNQPAGADAPISGNKPTAVPKESEKPYIYARDHNKTFSQIMAEEKAKYS